MRQGKTISIIFGVFILGILIAPILDGLILDSLNKSHYGLSQEENAEDPEKPDFIRVPREESENSDTINTAQTIVDELVYQYDATSGNFENLDLFPDSNTLLAVAYGIMGLAKGYQLFGVDEYGTMLAVLADAHAIGAGVNNTELGYFRNAEGIYYRDQWGWLVADSETNFWMILALLEAFHATADSKYLVEASRTLNALNATHWAGNYNTSYSGYLRSFEVDSDGQVLLPAESSFFSWEWALRDQLLAIQCLRKLAYFASPIEYPLIQQRITKIEGILPLYASTNISHFEEADFKPYHSFVDNYTITGNLQAANGSEILSLDHVLLYSYYVGKGIQLALGSAGEKALQGDVAGEEVYVTGIPPFPANLSQATTYLKNASDIRRMMQNFLTFESSLLSFAYFIFDPMTGTGELDFIAKTATNFLYVEILTEYAKILSNTTLANSLNLGPRKDEVLKRAYEITSTLFDQGIVNEEITIFEGAIDAEGGSFTEPSIVSQSRVAANAWAIAALTNILPLEVQIASYPAIEVNTNQTIGITIRIHPAPTLAWSPSVLGAVNYSLRGIEASVDFQLGEEKIPSKFLQAWSLTANPRNVTFYATKDEPGFEVANLKIQHLGIESLKISIPYQVVGQAILNIQEPAGGWEIVEGTEDLRIQITAKDSDGSDIANAHLEIWYQKEANPGDWFNKTIDPFASPLVVTLTNMDELDVGSHELIFFLDKDGYLPAEFVTILEVKEMGVLDRLRPILESEIAWWAGQILIALGVLWKFNTIVIRRIRGKVTTCSQCGSVTATSYPRCSACGHLWIEEGIQDMKGRIMDAVGDVASEVGLKRGDE